MNSETPNSEGTGYQISPGEATEIRRLFEEAQKHVAQLHQQNMIKRMKYGKAAKEGPTRTAAIVLHGPVAMPLLMHCYRIPEQAGRSQRRAELRRAEPGV